MKNRRFHSHESGQAIVLLVLAMVALLGFAALAIDGGRLYSERRHAQNSADAASLAGALQKANKQADSVVLQAVLASAASNGYSGAQVSGAIGGPFTDLFGKYYLVTATITSTLESTFAHFVYQGPLQIQVQAVAKAYQSQPALPGYAIVAMNPDCSGSPLIGVEGGGVDGGVETWQGGMFVNSPTSSNKCPLSPPTSVGSVGIVAHDGAKIASVGSVDYSGNPKVSPNPIETGLNWGEPISDPLADLPEPQCATSGSKDNSGPVPVYSPGSFDGKDLGPGLYQPGIYCISGDLKLAGSDTIEGDGVVLYFINGGMQITGNGGMRLTAPNTSNCLGTAGERTASCTYVGIVIFVARNNTSTIDVRGNGGDAVHGLIYGLNATIRAKGGGENPDETQVVGQIIAKSVVNAGNGSLKVTYNENEIFWKSPSLSLNR
ncbi:MAG: putative autotransporter protein [Anaerolineae bacterium]|jgi:Flp pilus assembly protein TadG|nr:MAG: putative autotransporter protein [Anaerolineae bacterium]